MQLVLELAHADAELFVLALALLGTLLHIEDAHHAGKVDALVGQLVDELQALDIGTRIQTRVAARALGGSPGPGLVDAQSLRMHAGQLGRHADHVQRFIPYCPRPCYLTPFRLVIVHHKPAGAVCATTALVRRLVTVDLLAIIARVGLAQLGHSIALVIGQVRGDLYLDLDEQRACAATVLNVGRTHLLKAELLARLGASGATFRRTVAPPGVGTSTVQPSAAS